MLDAFLKGLLNPLTNALSGLGKSISGALSGLIFGGGGGGAGGSAASTAGGIAGLAGGAGGIAGLFSSGVGIPGVAGAAGIDTGAGALSGLTPLLTNPWTIGIAAAIAGTYALFEVFKNQAHHQADDLVQNLQDPFNQALATIVDAQNAAYASGTETVDQANAAKAAVTQLWGTFQTQANQFATQGSNQAKVVTQAFQTLDPIMANILNSMNSQATILQTNAVNATTAATTATSSWATFFTSVSHSTSQMNSPSEAPPPTGGTATYNPLLTQGTERLNQHWEDAVDPLTGNISRTLVTMRDWTPAMGPVLPGHFLEAALTPIITTYGNPVAVPTAPPPSPFTTVFGATAASSGGTAQLNGAGSGATFNITIQVQGSVLTSDDLATVLAQRMPIIIKNAGLGTQWMDLTK
jgi:hypothetical protein